VPSTPTPTPGEPRVIEVEASNYQFTPDSISVKIGEKIIFEAYTTDSTHTFTIDALDVHIPLQSGTAAGATQFVATQTGTFVFYCGIHGRAAMSGTLTVTN
jgi:plastocyanin